jgi:hypothetical protein
MDSQVTFQLPCVKSPSASAKMIRALVRNRSPRYKAWVAAKIATGEWPLGVTSAEAAKLTPALMPVVCVRRSDCLPTAARN